jgi:hypothetical protein
MARWKTFRTAITILDLAGTLPLIAARAHPFGISCFPVVGTETVMHVAPGECV